MNTRINILQWILTKLGTYLDLKRIWNPIDFRGQRSRSQGLIFRRGDMPRFTLPLFSLTLQELCRTHTSCFKDTCILRQNASYLHNSFYPIRNNHLFTDYANRKLQRIKIETFPTSLFLTDRVILKCLFLCNYCVF